MASTYSPSLRLELMATGDQSGTWGDTTNTNLGTLLEQAITGVLSVTQGDAELTLTNLDGASDQARNAVVNLTGAMTGPQNVVVPTANKVYLIKNSTTGGFAVTVKTSAGSGVTVPATTARWVYCDGTNVVDGMSGPWSPSSNDAQALGLSGTAWSDLFLASGGVINWNAGDVTITHSANTLAFAGASSGYSFDAAVSAAGATPLTLTYTDAGAAVGPVADIYRDSSSPAANDILGQLIFNGRDSANNKQEYASIQAVIVDPTSTSEDATLDFYTQVAGSRVLNATMGPNFSISTNSNNVSTAPALAFTGDANTGIGSSGANILDIVANGASQQRFDATNGFSSVIAGGTTLYPEFKCRAWVNFNGTGTVAIRGSGNVSSITDNATGDYTVNFATALPDANYAGVVEVSVGGATTTTIAQIATNASFSIVAPTSTAFRVLSASRGGAVPTDVEHYHVSIFR